MVSSRNPYGDSVCLTPQFALAELRFSGQQSLKMVCAAKSLVPQDLYQEGQCQYLEVELLPWIPRQQPHVRTGYLGTRHPSMLATS